MQIAHVAFVTDLKLKQAPLHVEACTGLPAAPSGLSVAPSQI